MMPKTYNRITTTCMLVALASALVFDKLPEVRFLVGLFGIAAGVVAAIVYFWNLWSSGGGSEAVNLHEEAACATSSSVQQAVAPIGAIAPAAGSGEEGPVEVVAYQTLSGLLLTLEAMSVEAREQRYTYSIDFAVQLVDRLFTRRGREYEIVIHSDGRFVIRPYEVLRRGEEEREAEARILPYGLIAGGKVTVN